MLLFRFFSILTQATLLCCVTGASVPLELERSGEGGATFSKSSGIVDIKGPLGLLATPSVAPRADFNVLELEYFCIGGMPAYNVLPGPPFEEANTYKLPAMGRSEGWRTYSARITEKGKPLPSGWKQLLLELPLPADGTIQMRKARLRKEWPGEFDPRKDTPGASAAQPALTAYLDRKFPGSVTEVSIGKDYIRIAGRTGGGAGEFALADIPMDVILDDPGSFHSLVEITPKADGSFDIFTPRYRKRDGLDYDRLTSRWQIVSVGEAGIVPKSHARYGGRVECRSPDLPSAAPANKKGLGGWHIGRLPGELGELGISAVTVNVVVHSIVSSGPAENTVPTVWQGRKYHMRNEALAGLDSTFREARKSGAMVSAILLLGNPAKTQDPIVKIMGHPDAHKDGIFSMPNVTSSEGIGMYGAALNFMAERWSRPDGKFGRVHHWIMQNEVDAGWVWTNAGDKSDTSYMDLYHRSMRLMDLIARQYDPRSRPFISLTHHWANKGSPKWYGSKRLLELLVRFARAEGDFPWALAYHPYPQSLLNPRTWEDHQATFSFGTDKITPWNLEVLDAFMKRPDMLFRGTVRPVHLSENGFNSPDYSAKSLEDQAAGMAIAWKKMAKLSSIESWQYHNWIDNRREGGLRIGLRKFPDEPGDPFGKKPIWHLYKALGTPQEDKVLEPYLKTIGRTSWDEIIHKGAIR